MQALYIYYPLLIQPTNPSCSWAWHSSAPACVLKLSYFLSQIAGNVIKPTSLVLIAFYQDSRQYNYQMVVGFQSYVVQLALYGLCNPTYIQVCTILDLDLAMIQAMNQIG